MTSMEDDRAGKSRTTRQLKSRRTNEEDNEVAVVRVPAEARVYRATHMTLLDSKIKGAIPCGLERTCKMKVYINNSIHSTTGYEIVIKDDEGLIVETKPIDTLVDDGKTLKLPENPSNRKYFNLAKVEAADGIVELTYKETIKLGNREPSESKKPLEDYLNDEDKALYLALVEKAKAAKAEAHKKVPMTPIEKKKAQIERLKAQIAKMESEEA